MDRAQVHLHVEPRLCELDAVLVDRLSHPGETAVDASAGEARRQTQQGQWELSGIQAILAVVIGSNCCDPALVCFGDKLRLRALLGFLHPTSALEPFLLQLVGNLPVVIAVARAT